MALAGYEEIALELGYANRSGPHKAVQAALTDVYREDAETYRELQMERLNTVTGALFNRLEDGEVSAATPLLKALEAMDRYTGFNKDTAGHDRAATLLDALIVNSRAALELPQQP
ncbi:hypothetical protein EJ997_07905 [Flaviflexus ciconiae]|uniref:Uncharacterized protein n=1 Tax=Flaviflexus ciconiae TaxID=2496867 RepID=A0A3Q9G830_9ACTO|nr:hypothetical protein [Flaviflexus ciconiae]AZQ77267.1 hypothetical protein EJ997_07905 [Flaviflexus ciconiae]